MSTLPERQKLLSNSKRLNFATDSKVFDLIILRLRWISSFSYIRSRIPLLSRRAKWIFVTIKLRQKWGIIVANFQNFDRERISWKLFKLAIFLIWCHLIRFSRCTFLLNFLLMHVLSQYLHRKFSFQAGFLAVETSRDCNLRCTPNFFKVGMESILSFSGLHICDISSLQLTRARISS